VNLQGASMVRSALVRLRLRLRRDRADLHRDRAIVLRRLRLPMALGSNGKLRGVGRRWPGSLNWNRNMKLKYCTQSALVLGTGMGEHNIRIDNSNNNGEMSSRAAASGQGAGGRPTR
jgi:hypothetical protein